MRQRSLENSFNLLNVSKLINSIENLKEKEKAVTRG